MSDLKRTPLFSSYKESGAKTVDFGGFEMPVQFSGIIAEHEAVRTRAGLFDVSHMGEFEVAGKDAGRFIQSLVTNDVSRLAPGMAMYSPMANSNGGTVDDLLIYCFSETRFWLVVNAGNIDKDWSHVTEAATPDFDVSLVNKSNEIALLALQGPLAVKIVSGLTTADVSEVGYYRFVEATVADVPVVLSRTGYTGEDGFELYVDSSEANRLWANFLEAGREEGVIPCGLGARDTLRLEARLPLYGHELTEEISPLEAGLGIFVKLEAADFIGRDAISALKSKGLTKRIVGLKMVDKGIPRQGYRVLVEGRDVGYVTSGTMSPTLKQGIALALVDADVASASSTFEVDIRGKLYAAQMVKGPFYRRPQ